jgi:hypothetical protein
MKNQIQGKSMTKHFENRSKHIKGHLYSLLIFYPTTPLVYTFSITFKDDGEGSRRNISNPGWKNKKSKYKFQE